MLPESDTVRLRNRLIHAYFDINRDDVWVTASTDLPLLERQLTAVLQGHAGEASSWVARTVINPSGTLDAYPVSERGGRPSPRGPAEGHRRSSSERRRVTQVRENEHEWHLDTRTLEVVDPGIAAWYFRLRFLCRPPSLQHAVKTLPSRTQSWRVATGSGFRNGCLAHAEGPHPGTG